MVNSFEARRSKLISSQRQSCCSTEFLFEDPAGHAKGFAGALHDGAARSRLTTHEERNSYNPLIAADRDLGRRAIFHHIQQREDAIRREVNVPHLVAGLVQDMAERHRRYHYAFADASQFGRRQGGEQVILLQRAVIDHDQTSLLFIL